MKKYQMEQVKYKVVSLSKITKNSHIINNTKKVRTGAIKDK